MTVMNMKTNIQYIKGVGPTRLELLNKLGMYKVKDILTYFPKSYEDRTKVEKIKEFIEGEYYLFRCKITEKYEQRVIQKNITLSSILVEDETGKIKVTWFNRKYLLDKINIGDSYIIFGRTRKIGGNLEVDNPSFFADNDIEEITGIFPRYPLTKNLTVERLRYIIKNILESDKLFVDILEDDIKEKYNLCSIDYAIKNIHFPESLESVEIARRRLIFEELLMLQLTLFSIKNKNIKVSKKIPYSDVDYKKFKSILPFELTNAQKRVIDEIISDLSSTKSMNRLIEGDVGSGKTIVAAIAIYLAVKNGYQATMMAPTTILANQHYNELKIYLDKLNIKSELITGIKTKSLKLKVAKKLKNGGLDVVFGTHALLEDYVEFKNLGLVITDEQHRFGVNQRVKLVNKGESVDTIVMSATPIPRTLALMIYGDMDISIIDELPAGRKEIKTYVVDETYEERLDKFIIKNVNEGRQAYIVCPLIEESEDLEYMSSLVSVDKLFEKYKRKFPSKYKVECLHGKMKNKEKDEIMKKFNQGQIDILISTTVIEVGVNVPNANIIIIRNADRFGLAQLHQLRGRVGRGKHQSFCVLVSSNKSKSALERLYTMKYCISGFEVAEKDLIQRGPGEFFGTKQSGIANFKLANLLRDVNLLKLSADAAKEIIEKDPYLKSEKNIKIRKNIIDNYNEALRNIGT